MKLAVLLRSESIRVGSTVDDKAMALCEIASLAKQCDVLKNIPEETILEALQERETLGSTAFGNGIAIPHCRLKGIRDFVVGALTVPDGVGFESEDGSPVNLLIFIVGPRDENDAHIRLLSTLSQSLKDSAVVEQMIVATDAESLRSIFLQAVQENLSEQVALRRNLVHIFIQDDTVFSEILEALASLENISMSVLDMQSCRSYLANTPLYADIPANEQDGTKCIVAIVQRRLTNEIIRRVQTVTGSLFECTGVMVTSQELSYSSGSLEM